MVYFRLSHDEFQKLVDMCQDVDGARNVSELSRSAVQKLILKHENGSDGSVALLERLNLMIANLGEKVEELLAYVRAAQPTDGRMIDVPLAAPQDGAEQNGGGEPGTCN
jgi:hypothetical protein